MRVTCSFDRVSERHDVADLVCGAKDDDWEEVATQVRGYVDPLVRSPNIAVVIGPDGGTIYTGMLVQGNITVTAVSTPLVRGDV